MQCGAASCTAGVATSAAFCTGTGGACPTATTSACGLYVCGSTACKTTCSADTDCATGNYCTGAGGSCKPRKTLGAACGTGHECTSSNCVDGVCCSTASCGTCQSCSLNALGTCANIAAGQPAPGGQCSPISTCGYTGTCNGAGACTQAASATTCAPAICAASSVFYTPPATCSGTGTCGTPAALNCTPYLCTSTGCPTSCNGDADCIAADYCTGPGGSCVARAMAGVACTADDQCASTHCTDGFCCGVASCGSCSSCGVTGAQGACTPIPAGGADPTGTCTLGMQPAATCGADGLCDGAGGCQLWPATTQCNLTCPAGTSDQLATYCDGAGTCSATAVPVAHCAPLMCDGVASCRTACTGNADCVSGSCDTTTGICL